MRKAGRPVGKAEPVRRHGFTPWRLFFRTTDWALRRAV